MPVQKTNPPPAPLWKTAFPLFGVLAYWAVLYKLGGLHPEHFGVGAILLVTSYGGRALREVRAFVWPIIFTGMLYDSQRYYSNLIRGRVRVAEPYFFDRRFFGIHDQYGAVFTPNEWWQQHTHPALDFVTGFFYLCFIAIFLGICAWFRFGRPARRLAFPRLALKPMWAFFWTNMIGYSTYYWYPAAPPWYVALYGIGPARMDTPPNPAGTVRFDELLGTHFFTGMYGKSADVFGAIPSLHVSYPLIAAYFAFRYGSLRVFSVCFYLIMCFSAVYLNHHYVLDILWGSAYAIIVCLVLDRYWSPHYPSVALTTNERLIAAPPEPAPL